MYAARYYHPELPRLCGSSYHLEEVRELEALNMGTLANLRDLSTPGDPTRAALLAQGERWADHVLEGPRSWILCTAYILLTVTAGYTPLSAGVLAVGYGATGAWGWGALLGVAPHLDPLKYAVGFLDALLYVFLPWWMTVLLRLCQGRPWHHRVAGRSLLVGDIPWVAQSLEAYVSKLFALSYSIASLHVASGNPCDHLVHRHTHRVVRGGLLAVGRPDGRLNALASAENTVCLSVNQASSIQNMGVTLESFTLGHNPYQLGLSSGAVFLPAGRRKPFYSEWTLGPRLAKGMSAGAMLGLLADATRDELGISAEEKSRVSSPTKLQPRSLHFERIEPLEDESFVGAWMFADEAWRDASNAKLMERQAFVQVALTPARTLTPALTRTLQRQADGALVQVLHEGRFASLERFVGFLILFHRLGKRVQDWWPGASCGLLGYDMSRSHSIMRIATTASPVSGSEVRIKMLELAEETRRKWAIRTLQLFFRLVRREKAFPRLPSPSLASPRLYSPLLTFSRLLPPSRCAARRPTSPTTSSSASTPR